MKQIGKDILEAIALIRSYCVGMYQEDGHGKMMCCGCPFYRVSGMGVGFCRLTESDKHMPKYWGIEVEYCDLTGDGENRPVAVTITAIKTLR